MPLARRARNRQREFFHENSTKILKLTLKSNYTKVLEVWQGHLNNGYGLVLGYTVLHSKNSAVKGVLYIEDENKKRKLITTSDKLIMKSMESEEWVGKKIQFLNTILVAE